MVTGTKLAGADRWPGSEALPWPSAEQGGFGALDCDFSLSWTLLVFTVKERMAWEERSSWIWSCRWWEMMVAVICMVVVAGCHLQLQESKPATPRALSLWWIHCSLSSPGVTEVVDKERGESKKKMLADRVRAHHQGLWLRSYGAAGGWLPVSSAPPLILLVERRPIYFLPASMPKGRQYISCSASTASFSGVLAGGQCSGRGLGEPSGVVPGVDEIATVWDVFWTRLCSSFFVQGPLHKHQGLGCNFLFFLGHIVICTVPPLDL